MASGKDHHSLEEARDTVERYERETRSVWFSQAVIERETYWFFPVGFIGSCGVIVDKADLSLFPMGSALRLEDCFWGHEHGFSPDVLILRILAVHDVERAVEFLLGFAGAPPNRNPNPRRVWTRTALARLPYDCPAQNLWLRIPDFRAHELAPSFEYRLLPVESRVFE